MQMLALLSDIWLILAGLIIITPQYVIIILVVIIVIQGLNSDKDDETISTSNDSTNFPKK